MTDRERIEVLERRVDFLEESLKETLKQANRIADLLIKGTKKHEPQPQTDCAWQNDEYIPTELASTMLKERFKEQK